ncbi:hypothetical protein AGLY_000771 [Aphis glycines]|uniref:Uncharacterized protein n=1 Tax=Aphis glycines TaxID=307491 RepID=A0A6G0U7X8_APHGL|nr:hypothetical protein AGLY_000771 [Aphis glycines]
MKFALVIGSFFSFYGIGKACDLLLIEFTTNTIVNIYLTEVSFIPIKNGWSRELGKWKFFFNVRFDDVQLQMIIQEYQTIFLYLGLVDHDGPGILMSGGNRIHGYSISTLLLLQTAYVNYDDIPSMEAVIYHTKFCIKAITFPELLPNQNKFKQIVPFMLKRSWNFNKSVYFTFGHDVGSNFWTVEMENYCNFVSYNTIIFVFKDIYINIIIKSSSNAPIVCMQIYYVDCDVQHIYSLTNCEIRKGTHFQENTGNFLLRKLLMFTKFSHKPQDYGPIVDKGIFYGNLPIFILQLVIGCVFVFCFFGIYGNNDIYQPSNLYGTTTTTINNNNGNIPKPCYAIRSYDNNWYNYLYLYLLRNLKQFEYSIVEITVVLNLSICLLYKLTILIKLKYTNLLDTYIYTSVIVISLDDDYFTIITYYLKRHYILNDNNYGTNVN